MNLITRVGFALLLAFIYINSIQSHELDQEYYGDQINFSGYLMPPEYSNRNLTCRTKPELHADSGAAHFFNGCWKDTSKYSFFGSIGAQILEWFNEALYLQYITSFLFFFPIVAFNAKRELDTQAKANRLRCSLTLLLFRLGLAGAVACWFQALFQQPRPCECAIDGTDNYQPLGTVYGLPSIDIVVSTVMGLFLIQYFSKPLGLVLVLGVSYSRVVLGFDSVGQVLAGLIVGLVIHVYEIGSPIFMRLLDFIVNLVGGILTFILVKKNTDLNFNFVVSYLNGICWMGFALLVFALYYDMKFIRTIWSTPAHFLKDDMFLYYTPFHEGSLGSTTFSPQRKHEGFFFVVLVLLLFVALLMCRMYAPFITTTLDKIWS